MSSLTDHKSVSVYAVLDRHFSIDCFDITTES